jgi:hypothetical protein
MLRTRNILFVLAVALIAMAMMPGIALADKPTSDDPFVCPSVKPGHDGGMWVLGLHGAYYVLFPTAGKGSHADNAKVNVRVPDHVLPKAQAAAAWGLYKDYPSYPNFYSASDMIMLLGEGLVWLGSPAGWGEGHILMVTDNGDDTYTVVNMGNPMMNPPMPPPAIATIIITEPIPLGSGAIW